MTERFDQHRRQSRQSIGRRSASAADAAQHARKLGVWSRHVLVDDARVRAAPPVPHGFAPVGFLAAMVSRGDDKRAVRCHPAASQRLKPPIDIGRKTQRKDIDPQLNRRRHLVDILTARTRPGEVTLLDRANRDGSCIELLLLCTHLGRSAQSLRNGRISYRFSGTYGNGF